jgi:hypothetical protein
MNRRISRLLEEAEAQKHSSGSGESTVTSESRSFPTAAEADGFFEELRPELFRVSEWNGKTTLTSFELFDEKGNLADRKTAVVGDFIRLTMTGSGKYDWVRVIEIVDKAGEAIVTIKPSHDPTDKDPDKDATSHFFTSDATNNFCLEKRDAVVSFCVIGLSEKTNTDETESLVERARNVAVANIGSYFGIQKGEWKTFCRKFLRLTDEE